MNINLYIFVWDTYEDTYLCVIAMLLDQGILGLLYWLDSL